MLSQSLLNGCTSSTRSCTWADQDTQPLLTSVLPLPIHAPFSSGYFHHSTSPARRISIPTALSELISFTKYIYWEQSQAVRLFPGCQALLQVTATTYRNTQGKEHLWEPHMHWAATASDPGYKDPSSLDKHEGRKPQAAFLKAEELSTALVARASKCKASTRSGILRPLSHKEQEREVTVVPTGITIQNLTGSCKLVKTSVCCMAAVRWHTYIFRPLQLTEEKQYSTPQPQGLMPGWRWEWRGRAKEAPGHNLDTAGTV